MGENYKSKEKYIVTKSINKSFFDHGIPIPIDSQDEFLDNVENKIIELGKGKTIVLIFDDYKVKCSVRNIHIKDTKSRIIQIRYDGNIEFKKYLKTKFKHTYELLKNDSKPETDEYIEIYKGNEINNFYIETHTHVKLDEEGEKFINTVKSTSMSKSYKIPLFWAFYNEGNMKLKINEDDIYKSFKEFYSKKENATDLQGQKNTDNYQNWNKNDYVKFVKERPIKYLLEGTPEYFYKEDNLFCISDKIQKYIDNKDFKEEFRNAIEELQVRYSKRNINNNYKTENEKEYMGMRKLIEAFEKEYDSNNDKEEKLRKEFIETFPIESLDKLDLDKYALGKKPYSLCWWLEYNTIPLGSIKGGNAKKYKIYFASKENKWVYPSQFETVDQGWNELRTCIYNLVNSFKLGNYEDVCKDSIVSSMKMFKTKLLYMYFPEKLLPVYSLDHIQKLLIQFGYNSSEISSLDIINANMKLKEFKDNHEYFKNWDGLKFMRFLYYKVLPKVDINNNAINVADIDCVDVMNHINNYIKNQGYIYTKEQLSNLYLSLKTKPFVILAGISGTGKSKIVRLFANALGATTENNQFNLISVRPDWNDGCDLIGYKNLNDEFIEGQLTKTIIEASKPENKDKPYFICLDEMNLARVEYYLSDYLSVIESRQKVGQEIITDKLVQDKDLHIPQNVYLIGTVNMDDTTFTFSRKVLDRANTIEFSDVDLENLFGDSGNENIETLNINNHFLKTNYLKTIDIEEEYREYAKEINKKIIEINEILKKSKKQFAYRVRDEILFYMIENKKSELLDENLAFDYQIMQKILPAINGSERSIEKILVDLFNFICEKTVIEFADIEEAENYLQNEEVRYKNSAEKIIYMLKGYNDDGYVSYWY